MFRGQLVLTHVGYSEILFHKVGNLGICRDLSLWW